MTVRILAVTGEFSTGFVPKFYKCFKNSCNIELKIKTIHYTKQIKFTMQMRRISVFSSTDFVAGDEIDCR
jgi:hypothetical protein